MRERTIRNEIASLRRAMTYLADNWERITQNPFRKNNDDLLFRALKYQCKLRRLQAEVDKDEARPCISCQPDVRDTGGNKQKAVFRFCFECFKETGHSQHEIYANRCRWCAIQLRIAKDIPCYGEKGVYHDTFKHA